MDARTGGDDQRGRKEGTATVVRRDDMKIAAKTGTAQVGSKEHRRQIAWLSGYLPADNPKYAFSVMVEGRFSDNRNDTEEGGLSQWPQKQRDLQGHLRSNLSVPVKEKIAKNKNDDDTVADDKPADKKPGEDKSAGESVTDKDNDSAPVTGAAPPPPATSPAPATVMARARMRRRRRSKLLLNSRPGRSTSTVRCQKWHRRTWLIQSKNLAKDHCSTFLDNVRVTLEQAAELLGATVNQFVTDSLPGSATRHWAGNNRRCR